MKQLSWLEKWNINYSSEDFVYGKLPNVFFQDNIDVLPAQTILLGAEGEGRNAVYAATKGWDVTAFDISKEGKRKALILAEEKKTQIDYRVGELPTLNFPTEKFDVIALIYAHFPAEIRSEYHKILVSLLKKGA